MPLKEIFIWVRSVYHLSIVENLIQSITKLPLFRFMISVAAFHVGSDAVELLDEPDPVNRVNISAEMNMPENYKCTLWVVNNWGLPPEMACLRHHYYLSFIFGSLRRASSHWWPETLFHSQSQTCGCWSSDCSWLKWIQRRKSCYI